MRGSAARSPQRASAGSDGDIEPVRVEPHYLAGQFIFPGLDMLAHQPEAAIPTLTSSAECFSEYCAMRFSRVPASGDITTPHFPANRQKNFQILVRRTRIHQTQPSHHDPSPSPNVRGILSHVFFNSMKGHKKRAGPDRDGPTRPCLRGDRRVLFGRFVDFRRWHIFRSIRGIRRRRRHQPMLSLATAALAHLCPSPCCSLARSSRLCERIVSAIPEVSEPRSRSSGGAGSASSGSPFQSADFVHGLVHGRFVRLSASIICENSNLARSARMELDGCLPHL